MIRDWRRRAGVVLVVGAIATIQSFTPLEHSHWHYIVPRLYYLPVVFAALHDGWRGGLMIALLSSAAFFQQFLKSDDLFTERLITAILSWCRSAHLPSSRVFTQADSV